MISVVPSAARRRNRSIRPNAALQVESGRRLIQQQRVRLVDERGAPAASDAARRTRDCRTGAPTVHRRPDPPPQRWPDAAARRSGPGAGRRRRWQRTPSTRRPGPKANRGAWPAARATRRRAGAGSRTRSIAQGPAAAFEHLAAAADGTHRSACARASTCRRRSGQALPCFARAGWRASPRREPAPAAAHDGDVGEIEQTGVHSAQLCQNAVGRATGRGLGPRILKETTPGDSPTITSIGLGHRTGTLSLMKTPSRLLQSLVSLRPVARLLPPPAHRPAVPLAVACWGLFCAFPAPSAETLGTVNRPPKAVGTLPDWALRVSDGSVTVDVASAFTDPDEDPLEYTASVSQAPGGPPLLVVNFDATPLGDYTLAAFHSDWPGTISTHGFGTGRAEIVDGASAYAGRSLRLKYPAGTYWGLQPSHSGDDRSAGREIRRTLRQLSRALRGRIRFRRGRQAAGPGWRQGQHGRQAAGRNRRLERPHDVA